MRIVRLHIENFRSIKTARLFPEKHNVYLGPNNIGKTSIVEGLNSSSTPKSRPEAESSTRTTFITACMIVARHAHRADADVGELRRLHYVAATWAKKGLGVFYVRNDLGSVVGPVLQGGT